jgi:cell division protein FtsQ
VPAVAAPADKRFRRARVKPARRRGAAMRQAWTATRVVCVFAAMAYGGWRLTALVLTTPALQVSRITVRGNERLATGEVLALVAGLRERNILTVRLDQWRARLLSSPWVEDAILRRTLPSTVDVVVRERRPIGIGRLTNGLYLVDARGVVIDEYGPNYGDLDLPIIDGLASVPRDGSSALDETRALLAARLIAALQARPDLGAKVSQIDVSDSRDAVVILDGDTAMLRLGDSDFVERLQEYVDLEAALRERIPEIDYVDLRFDERLYVRPVAQTGSGRSSASAKARKK